MTNEVLGRDAHWFDGDGMLSGVLFRRRNEESIQPEFVNQYILTDVYVASISSSYLKIPILPSIATLVNPMSSLFTILFRILRTIILVILSHLPGSCQPIRKISVANTAVVYHNQRALATCESGPPMRIALPGLETIGWFNGHQSENEEQCPKTHGFGGTGLSSFLKEFTTAHPRVDPNTQELLLYHSTFVPPYVHYSIVPPSTRSNNEKQHWHVQNTFLNRVVPGVKSAKLMHDFGVTRTHTIIMDLPLSLDPLNLTRNRPPVTYDPSKASRFGIFPRYNPERVVWFETDACCIFHTANSWDSKPTKLEHTASGAKPVNMLACRLTSASLVFSAGDIAAPTPIPSVRLKPQEEEQCRLYFYQFVVGDSPETSHIAHQWALSAIPFEFPSLRDSVSMSPAKYVYGCSVSDSSFGAALGRAVKINAIVKVNVETLVERGKLNPPEQIRGCVDLRSVREVLESTEVDDPIRIFKMPEGWYAQESRFVPREDGVSEDDGWVLSYVFDESQLDEDGECRPDAKSELWIIDAKNMKDIVARVYLPQRVPYGLHGNWFTEAQVSGQRPYEQIRKMPSTTRTSERSFLGWSLWMATRHAIESLVG